MRTLKMYILTIMLAIFVVVKCEIKSRCQTKETCGECIGYAYESCVWCSADDHIGKRCSLANVSTDWCKENVYNPSESVTFVENMPINSGVNGIGAVQLSPQKINITARPGKEVSFKINYKPALDYPLDIYYLMDNSYTMRLYLKELQSEGHNIPKILSRVTNNVRLGIGTFVEKPALPYAKKINNAYSFQNHLSLTTDTDHFKEAIGKIPKDASNYDDPEAGFDGLMQVMACEDQIGWRPDAWRVIILCTDSTYHSAGDGNKVGALYPNDMKCHLQDGKYSEALRNDYPSVSQINSLATARKFSIMFAATFEAAQVYEALAQRIMWSKYVELQKDPAHVVNIIQDEYKKLSQNMRLDTKHPEDVQLAFKPDCRETNNKDCYITYNTTKELTVTLKVMSCSASTKRVEINTIGNDKIIVDVDPICKCSCEDTKFAKENSTMCSSTGTYQCGMCKCNANSFGDKCECSQSTADKSKYNAQCIPSGNNSKPCNGRGICRCGKCLTCDNGFSGPFCEYDDNACLRYKGELCSNQGKCTLGHCECQMGWTEDDCRCPDHNRDCLTPYSSEVCSGNGDCVCGKCVCKKKTDKNETYSGVYCDSCEECVDKKCEELNKYIDRYCSLDAGVVTCNSTDEVEMKTMSKENLVSYKNAYWCSKSLEKGCSINYKFEYDSANRKLQFMVQVEEECPYKANVWIACGATIGSILLIGLLTAVAWKILIDIHDAREFRIFQEQSAAEGYNLNPLYKEPNTTNFENPAFRRSIF